MAVLLVLCDPEDAVGVAGAIEELGRTFRLSSSDFLLSTDRQRDDVWRELRARADLRAPEALLLISMHEPFPGIASGEVRRWLRHVVAGEADDEA
jgi:hypothetical protein